MWGVGPGAGTGWNEWSLNPSHYANLPHEQVDWAALAQQWIQMKTGNQETLHPQQQPPPLPLLSQRNQYQTQQQHPPPLQMQEPPPPLVHQQSQSQPQQPLLHLHHQSQSDLHKHRQANQHVHQSSQFQWQTNPNSEIPNERLLPPPPPPPTDSRPNYSFPPAQTPVFLSHHPNITHPMYNRGPQWGVRPLAPPIRDKYYTTNLFNSDGIDYSDDNMQAELEAARRRSLPVWIREGLEKVEREKRKQEEKDRLTIEREAKRKLELEQNSSGESKWTSDVHEEESGDESDPVILPENNKKSPFTQRVASSHPEEDLQSILNSMSEEERLEQIMVIVRRQLTQILLEVTTEEIEVVAQECLHRSKQKVISATQVRKTGALASLTTGPLGLGDYGTDSDSAGSETEESINSDQQDSEAELMAELERKKRLFKLREVELGQKSPSRSKGSSRSGSESKDINLITIEQRVEKVEKTNLSVETKGKSDFKGSPDFDKSSIKLDYISKPSQSKKGEPKLPAIGKTNSHLKIVEKSRDRSISISKGQRRSRSHSKSNGRKEPRSSKRVKSRSRSTSSDRSLSNDRIRRKSRSRSKSNGRKTYRSSKRFKSRSLSDSRDRSLSNAKNQRKSRSKSKEKKSYRRSRRGKSRSRSSSRQRRKTRCKSKERRTRRKSPRKRSRSRSKSNSRRRKSRIS